MSRGSGIVQGGMRSVGVDYDIDCPKCRKLAARAVYDWDKGFEKYLYFTKKDASGMGWI